MRISKREPHQYVELHVKIKILESVKLLPELTCGVWEF